MKTDVRINVMYCVRLVHAASFSLSSFARISGRSMMSYGFPVTDGHVHALAGPIV